MEPTRDASDASAAEAAEAAEAEVSRLLALEQRNLEATGGALRQALDAKYVAMRKDLTEVMSSVAQFYDAGWDAAQLGMALLDAYRVRTVHAGGLEPELAAVALLGISICFVRDPSCGGRAEERSLRLLVERWRAQVAQVQRLRVLRPLALEVRPLFLEQHSRGLVSSVRRAQVQVLAGLDWRLSVATANVLLEGLLALDLRGADEHIGGRALAAEDRAELARDARSFCQLGLLRGYSWFYGQSVLAAACVHAARLVSKVEPAWTEALAARCRVASLDDMELCVRDLMHAYHAKESSERECPRTPNTRGTQGTQCPRLEQD
jgi:hypothetical protein